MSTDGVLPDDSVKTWLISLYIVGENTNIDGTQLKFWIIKMIEVRYTQYLPMYLLILINNAYEAFSI